jgi:hypothetical protein
MSPGATARLSALHTPARNRAWSLVSRFPLTATSHFGDRTGTLHILKVLFNAVVRLTEGFI